MINLSKKNLQNNSILTSRNNFISYKFLEKESCNIRKKIKENSLVIFFANNDVESIMLYYALLKHDVTILLLDDTLNLKEALRYIKDYKPSYILFPKKNDYELNNFQIIFENNKFYLSKNRIHLNYILNLHLNYETIFLRSSLLLDNYLHKILFYLYTHLLDVGQNHKYKSQIHLYYVALKFV